jgi:hypothetical protein
MNIFATRHYRSAHGLMRVVCGLNYRMPAKIISDGREALTRLSPTQPAAFSDGE